MQQDILRLVKHVLNSWQEKLGALSESTNNGVPHRIEIKTPFSLKCSCLYIRKQSGNESIRRHKLISIFFANKGKGLLKSILSIFNGCVDLIKTHDKKKIGFTKKRRVLRKFINHIVKEDKHRLLCKY